MIEKRIYYFDPPIKTKITALIILVLIIIAAFAAGYSVGMIHLKEEIIFDLNKDGIVDDQDVILLLAAMRQQEREYEK